MREAVSRNRSCHRMRCIGSQKSWGRVSRDIWLIADDACAYLDLQVD
jgi:hypothetical protein